jgi:hypothetical protein
MHVNSSISSEVKNKLSIIELDTNYRLSRLIGISANNKVGYWQGANGRD